MTDPFHHYRRSGPRRCWAALLGGLLFCRLFLFLYGYYQNVFLLSFLLVAFAVDVCVDVESNLGPGSNKRVPGSSCQFG